MCILLLFLTVVQKVQKSLIFFSLRASIALLWINETFLSRFPPLQALLLLKPTNAEEEAFAVYQRGALGKGKGLCVLYTALSPDSPPHKDYRPNESHKKESRGGGSKATKTKCLALFSPCFPKLLSRDRVVGKRASQQQQQKNPLAAVVAAEAFFIASTFLYVNQSTMGISKTLHFIISIFVVSFEKGHRAPRDHWQETNFAKEVVIFSPTAAEGLSYPVHTRQNNLLKT